MLEEDRVFDVSKPGHGSPQATSKPVIVGHRPLMTDPMVRGDNQPLSKHISVFDKNETSEPAPEPLANDEIFKGPSPGIFSQPEAGDRLPALAPEPPAEQPHITEPNQPPALDDVEPLGPARSGHVEGLHLAPAKKGRRPSMLVLLGVLIILIAAYLLIDSGAIKTSINLPFHVFKQKSTPAPTPPPAPVANRVTTPAVPAGFTKYKLAGTSLTFAAPTAWGGPGSSTDPGYTKRGGTNKSDGTYAYIVDFATNKDVQIAVTSNKYLPTTRSALYYDYLQWCTGTADGKIYLSTMHFTTVDKVDSPGTVSCDQGPLTNATKLDASTIVQLGAKTTDGQPFGDLYTKNLNNVDLPAFRVRDSKSASSTEIKQLLATVAIPAAASASTTAAQ